MACEWEEQEEREEQEEQWTWSWALDHTHTEALSLAEDPAWRRPPHAPSRPSARSPAGLRARVGAWKESLSRRLEECKPTRYPDRRSDGKTRAHVNTDVRMRACKHARTHTHTHTHTHQNMYKHTIISLLFMSTENNVNSLSLSRSHNCPHRQSYQDQEDVWNPGGQHGKKIISKPKKLNCLL